MVGGKRYVFFFLLISLQCSVFSVLSTPTRQLQLEHRNCSVVVRGVHFGSSGSNIATFQYQLENCKLFSRSTQKTCGCCEERRAEGHSCAKLNRFHRRFVIVTNKLACLLANKLLFPANKPSSHDRCLVLDTRDL